MSFSTDKPVFRPSWVSVDLAALIHNYHVIKKRLAADVGIMAMVKADAYGHGAVKVARALESCGTKALGVATVEEGVELREAGTKSQIVVMGGLMGAGSMASETMIEADLTPVIHSPSVLDSLETGAARVRKKIGVHLKVDTGMSRLGVRPEVIESVASHLGRCPHLYVEGVMTHLAEAADHEVSTRQMDLFLKCRGVIEARLGRIRIWHVANSMALLKGEPVDVPDADEVWARPGLLLYGSCNETDLAALGVKPVMGLASKLVLLKYVPAGVRVSYGGTYTTTRKTRLGIVPIGYADGYPWGASGKAFVLLRGRRVPVVGRVTMDMIIIDVTDVEGTSVNDEVVLLGTQGLGCITLSEIASWAGTITYEILCGISKRMPRIYI